ELFEEDANRCLVLHSDERPEQTRKILLADAKQVKGESTGERRDQVRKEFQCLHRLLVPLEVVIPYAERLAELFPDEPLEVRRSFGHLTSMVQTITLLHQYQRERDEVGRIVAQPDDYFLARLLLDEVFGQSLGRKASEGLKRFVVRVRKFTGEHTAKELAQAMNMSERTAREHLTELLERGVITQSTQARGPIPAEWSISTSLEINDVQESPLPSVFDVCGVSEEELQLPEMPADWTSADLNEVPF
ncbi:MAG: HTH domain-containing protein, partial [Schlesneria sp.]